MPVHEPEILQGRVDRIAVALVGLSMTEQLSTLGVMAGRLVSACPEHLQPQAFELIGRAVQLGVKTAPR